MKLTVTYIHPIMKTTHEQVIEAPSKIKAEELFCKRFVVCPEIVSINKVKIIEME